MTTGTLPEGQLPKIVRQLILGTCKQTNRWSCLVWELEICSVCPLNTFALGLAKRGRFKHH